MTTNDKFRLFIVTSIFGLFVAFHFREGMDAGFTFLFGVLLGVRADCHWKERP
jgi:hypothetical protein